MKNFFKLISYVLTLNLLVACSNHPKTDNIQNNNMNSALWYQNSIEFKAHSLQTFRLASQLLELSLKDKNWSASITPSQNFQKMAPAIIVDTDETILDNTAYDAQRILTHTVYDHDSWDKWLALSDAQALPGAIEFLNRAGQLGVKVFYVTNRRCKQRQKDGPACPQREEHIENLKKLGVSSLEADQMLLFDEHAKIVHSKEDRRQLISRDYRVLLIVGDDLGDFVKDRADYKAEYQKYWGEKWIMLANPKYGSWLRALKPPYEQHLKPFKLE